MQSAPTMKGEPMRLAFFCGLYTEIILYQTNPLTLRKC